MRLAPRLIMVAVVALALGGCQSADDAPPSLMPVIGPGGARKQAKVTRPSQQPAPMKVIQAPVWQPKPTPGTDRTAARSDDATPVQQLPPFEVHERRFSNFGLSVITNVGVMRGGPIAWMRVGQVVSGSSADRSGVRPGDEILAIDDALLAEVSREQMLQAFFGREKNDTVKLVLFGGKDLVPRIVVLKAGQSGVELPRAK
jgi:hypothetical protein